MNVIIFGASGGTGSALVQRAHGSGHRVTAFVRKRTEFRVETMQILGDALDAEAVIDAIANQDAVLSALGARDLRTDDFLRMAIQNIAGGMHRHSVHRVVVLGAAGALGDPLKNEPPFRKWMFSLLKHTLLKNPFADSGAQQKILQNGDLDYTVVLPPRLTYGPPTGKYRLSLDGLPAKPKKISRSDVAEFMMNCLDQDAYVRQCPYIAN
jgi:putative NADH-flavin reductase